MALCFSVPNFNNWPLHRPGPACFISKWSRSVPVPATSPDRTRHTHRPEAKHQVRQAYKANRLVLHQIARHRQSMHPSNTLTEANANRPLAFELHRETSLKSKILFWPNRRHRLAALASPQPSPVPLLVMSSRVS
ncbi:hypothetical protein VTI28DRAFT_2972 [Corynascus sepedonium]